MSAMGNSTLWGKIAVLIAVCGWCLSAQAKYAGGSGEPNNPYQIGSVDDWQELMATPVDWAGHFVLTADIDLNNVPTTPVGNDPNWFTGVFDGNDYVIRNVDVNMPGSDYVGLFGYLGTDGQIRNLSLENASILGGDYVGGLVGYNYRNGAIINCYSTGTVSGNYNVGGLVGRNNYGTIINCYSTGSVSGTGSYVGGLVGYCSYYGTISNCYSTGSVTGDSYVGGLVGNNYGTIINSYSTGSVSGSSSVGGLVGNNYQGTISNSFWDVNTSGRTTSAGGTGRTTSQMQDINTFLEAGWDFVEETANGTCNFWLMAESGSYPALSTFNGYIPGEPRGSGTEADPYIITDANELGTVWYRPSAYYVMGNEVDLAGINWSAPVVPFFSGVFDGNDYVIRNADVNMAGSYVGLFGYLGTDGQVKNLGVEDASILGDDYVGGLVGLNDSGTIINCYSTGSVSGTGNYYVGGLVGLNDYGTIINSYSTGSVSGSSSVGGLVGWNYGTISNCYSTGSVIGSFSVGGLLGYTRYGSISDCYSTGSVIGSFSVGGLLGVNDYGTISNCYSTGSVSGSYQVGGLVGANDYGTISDCYSSKSVTGEYRVGGLVGANGGQEGYSGRAISNCYSTGTVSGSYMVGGLVGGNYGTITNCCSTGSINGEDGVGGLVGENGYSEMQCQPICDEWGNCWEECWEELWPGWIYKCYSTGKVS